jgi:cytochrome c oxidase cbb3-type subunit 1
MEKFVKRFILASLVYFLLGVSLGLAIVTFPSLQMFIHEGPGELIRWVHVHLNLLGWVSLGLAAVIYWVVYQLTGKIYSLSLVNAHFWLANIGLIGMLSLSAIFGVTGGLLYQKGVPEGAIYARFTGALIIDLFFAFVLGVSIFIFAYNIWRSLRSIKL